MSGSRELRKQLKHNVFNSEALKQRKTLHIAGPIYICVGDLIDPMAINYPGANFVFSS